MKYFASIIIIFAFFSLMLTGINFSHGLDNHESDLEPTFHVKSADIMGIGFIELDKLHFTTDDYIKRNLTLPHGISQGSCNLTNKRVWSSLKEEFHENAMVPGGEILTLLFIYSNIGGVADLNTILPNNEYLKFFTSKFDHFKIKLINELNFTSCDTPTNLVYISENGASTKVSKSSCNDMKISQRDVKYHLIKNYKMVVTDSGMWDEGVQSKAIVRAYNIAEKVHTKRVLLLSDIMSIKHHRTSLMALIDKLDVLITSESSLYKLMQTNSLSIILEKLKHCNKLIVITKENLDTIIINGANIITVPNITIKPNKIIDKTGMQSAFAAGFLYGQAHDLNLNDSVNYGQQVAFTTSQQIGGYPLKLLGGSLLENSSN